ncbi:hypothetical protein [Luteimonas abyssi]|uniref:hypothetical protein n=1 Tax=Luteimonas abyssi TaxID=1247514 RepID=UPI000737C445|nr:hypothetical protein [Luteimonas abyssi]
MSADETLLHALLAELAAHPDGVSLPKLCKRLGIRMSVLMRTLTYLGEDTIGDAPGPGWIRTFEDGERTLARLTDAGRAVVASLPGGQGPMPSP